MEYYLDVEVAPEDPNGESSTLTPENYKIITIQFQQLDARGRPNSPLLVLKEWESGERGIIETFSKFFFRPGRGYASRFEFVPVGFNLQFDIGMLRGRAERHGVGVPSGWQAQGGAPVIDLHPICLGMNGFRFSGSGLANFCAKDEGGKGVEVPGWYARKDYETILRYVEVEAREFVELYARLKAELPKFRAERKFFGGQEKKVEGEMGANEKVGAREKASAVSARS